MKVIFVYAHPDDECLYSGGTIPKLVSENIEVKLICATKGEAGTTGNPLLCTQEDLGKVREQELRNAAKVLGISEIFFLGFMDGTLSSLPQSSLQDSIEKILEQEKPDVVYTFGKEGGTHHPDHKQICIDTTIAFANYMSNVSKHVRLYYAVIPKSYVKRLESLGTLYTFFGKVEGVPDESVTTTIDVSETIEKKIEAFKCHKTQKNDWELFLTRKSAPEFTKEFFTLAMENEIA